MCGDKQILPAIAGFVSGFWSFQYITVGKVQYYDSVFFLSFETRFSSSTVL